MFFKLQLSMFSIFFTICNQLSPTRLKNSRENSTFNCTQVFPFQQPEGRIVELFQLNYIHLLSNDSGFLLQPFSSSTFRSLADVKVTCVTGFFFRLVELDWGQLANPLDSAHIYSELKTGFLTRKKVFHDAIFRFIFRC